jgi:hypothetical protein
MHINAFIGKTEEPTEEELSAELGASRSVWDQLFTRLAADCDVVTWEWNSYSPKAGWAVRFKVKKRNILYLGPHHGGFTASFVLGDKAVQAARSGKTPAKVIKLLDEGKRYPEGTAVRIEVKAAQDIDTIVNLTAIKLQH